MANARWTERLMQVLWPAFIAACILQLVVFAMVDPAEVHGLGGITFWSAGWSRQAVYAVAFFVFWAICSVASTLTAVLTTQASPEVE